MKISWSNIRHHTDLHAEDAGNPDSASDALKTQRGHLWVITVLQPHAERSQQGGPCQLEHTEIINRFTFVVSNTCLSLDGICDAFDMDI